MTYASLHECIEDLEKHGHLVRVREKVDPFLEMAEIHRRVFQAGGPAVFYEQVKGSPFPAVSNLFGTMDRARFIFRNTLDSVKKLVRIKADPSALWKDPLSGFQALGAACHALPVPLGNAAAQWKETSLNQLPQIQSWPKDGGPFILLPQVYTEDPENPGVLRSNLGMYRIQLAGNRYEPQEIGLHYQIRRDIGIHHAKALALREPLRVSIFIGGPPAHTFSAVMYLPENLSELAFAGALAGRNFRYARRRGFLLSSDADFCITGFVDPKKTKPEGPFGDHLGYYSLQHEFPVMTVEKVYHRKNAVWPFTVVGRPPQEDSVFGKLVQEIAGPMIPKEIPGIKAIHAVDESGVHPLLLAVGKERYVPYKDREPQEILTHAHALLGYGPCSLAKYLLIAAEEDDPDLDVRHIPGFFHHVLERVDWKRDLHFQPRSTMDTLDYSGTGLNAGSKLVIAAAGSKKRNLSASLPGHFKMPHDWSKPQMVMPGVLAVQDHPFQSYEQESVRIPLLLKEWGKGEGMEGIPLVVVTDDADFTAKNLANFLWVTFTRSNPSHDTYGAGSFTEFKHWGCQGPLVIDARIKPHHAPQVEPDPEIVKRVEALAAPERSLHGIF